MFLRLGGHFLAPCRLFQLADPRGRQLRAKNELKMVTRSDYCPQADPTGEGGRVNTIPWDAEPPKMTGTFECYEVELQLFLKRFKCWSIVDGTEVRHTEDTAKQQEFDDLDNFARYCILSGVNQDDKELIYKESTAHAMWLRFVSLKTKQKTSFCHASRVREAVHSDVYTKDKDMIGWISGLEMQRRRLDSSPWAFSDTEFADLILKHAWLTHRAVHRQFAKSYVDQPPPSQQVASAEDNVDRMLEDAPLEIPLGVAAAATSGHKDPSVPQGHGDTKVCGGEGKGKRKRKQPPKPSEPCFKCKQLGHWKKECPKKKQKKTNA